MSNDQKQQSPNNDSTQERAEEPRVSTEQQNSLTEAEASTQTQGNPVEQNGSSAQSPTVNAPQNKQRSKGLVNFLRFVVVGGGFFGVFVVGLGISFSACFTIKGPPPPECGPVSFVSLILMPGASLFFLIPLAKKIK